jgi:hypothetical protein
VLDSVRKHQLTLYARPTDAGPPAFLTKVVSSSEDATDDGVSGLKHQGLVWNVAQQQGMPALPATSCNEGTTSSSSSCNSSLETGVWVTPRTGDVVGRPASQPHPVQRVVRVGGGGCVIVFATSNLPATDDGLLPKHLVSSAGNYTQVLSKAGYKHRTRFQLEVGADVRVGEGGKGYACGGFVPAGCKVVFHTREHGDLVGIC